MYINYDGQLLPATQPILKAGDRNLQYGDGVFETMRIHQGKILFWSEHFQRLSTGLELLRLSHRPGFDKKYLEDSIVELSNRNEHSASGRVRLTVFRKATSAIEPPADLPVFIIESWPLEGYTFLEQPFEITLYQDAYKSIDQLSGCKTSGYLIYAMAAVFARQEGFNDALVMNTGRNICDASIANVFWVKNDQVFTPPLAEGCINGVMRRHLVNNFPVTELPLNLQALETANEVFLTNVIRGIIPVSKFGKAFYETKGSRNLFNTLVLPLTGQ